MIEDAIDREGPRDDDVAATRAAEWLAEFERAQLLLRLSPRLRQLHGD
jgi:hypothetical protein